MKVIILAGGSGTRISEYTKKTIPKLMIKIKKTINSPYYGTLFKIWSQ